MLQVEELPTTVIPKWARRTLQFAGVYNLVWGAFTVLFPHFFFDVAGAERMRYPQIWQCVGMIVGVYGIGYLIAAGNPFRHWPIVLVGLLGKIFGPIGFAFSIFQGGFPVEFGLNIITNDLIWWIPFSLIIWKAAWATPPDPASIRKFVWESPMPGTREQLFELHQPEMLANLIPPWEKVKVVSAPASLLPGSTAILEQKIGPFRLRWVAEHISYDPPHEFVDQQVTGPFAYWHHRHRMIELSRSESILRDEVTYALPLGQLSDFLFGWLVRRKMAAMFRYRHEQTRLSLLRNSEQAENKES
ncbi:MAG: SRPBCC family protein [Zavarzinella sp.]